MLQCYRVPKSSYRYVIMSRFSHFQIFLCPYITCHFSLDSCLSSLAARLTRLSSLVSRLTLLVSCFSSLGARLSPLVFRLSSYDSRHSYLESRLLSLVLRSHISYLFIYFHYMPVSILAKISHPT